MQTRALKPEEIVAAVPGTQPFIPVKEDSLSHHCCSIGFISTHSNSSVEPRLKFFLIE
jgi:hypothetical protein